jgi:hypothetical protein
MTITNQKVSEREPRGERVARFVESYLDAHKGLCIGELAFRIKATKRDMQRLLRDRSCGWRLEDNLAAYFGDLFVDAIFKQVVGQGRSKREQELERECAEIAALREQIERERARRRTDARAAFGVLAVQNRGLVLQGRS